MPSFEQPPMPAREQNVPGQQIAERLQNATSKNVIRRAQEFLERLNSGNPAEVEDAQLQLKIIKDDFEDLVKDPNNRSAGGKNYAGWTPDEIRELHIVLYGEPIDEEG